MHNQKEPKQETRLSSANFPLYTEHGFCGMGYTFEPTAMADMKLITAHRSWQAFHSIPAKAGHSCKTDKKPREVF